jgi:hypothetical protein
VEDVYVFFGGAGVGGKGGDISDQISAIGRQKKAYTEIAEDTEFAERRKAEEGSLDYATRRAKMRRGRKNRVAPLGMTKRERTRNYAEETEMRIPEEPVQEPAQEPVQEPVQEPPQEHSQE